MKKANVKMAKNDLTFILLYLLIDYTKQRNFLTNNYTINVKIMISLINQKFKKKIFQILSQKNLNY